ncbi:MAG: hypothetical protein DRN81_02685 [Thermoproteota archaeon]|nr:MAG: hypothetical protein DRN81_02685 [Candidatus Korarchaeota archaeon]
MPLKIRHNIPQAQKALQNKVDEIRKLREAFLTESEIALLNAIRSEAPRGKTKYGKVAGTLQESFEVEREMNRRIFKPDEGVAPYAKYVVTGTRRSPGRFVPAIGRRLRTPSRTNPTIGYHPGTRANPFVARAVRKAREKLRKIITRLLGGLRL